MMQIGTEYLRFEPVKTVYLNEQTKSFPLDIVVNQDNLILGLSDHCTMLYSLERMQPIWAVQSHSKRINQVCMIDHKIVASCSGDATIKLYDLQSGQIINTLKNQNNDEFYALDCSQHILAGGSEGAIRFYDLRQMKLRSTFNESQSDEISGVKFNPKIPTQLLASSLDGLLVLYDLTQNNEEDSLTNMIKFNEPLNSCSFIDENYCQAISTMFAIYVVNLQKGEQSSYNPIQHDEFNEEYLVDTQVSNGKLSYFKSHKNDSKMVKQYSLDGTQMNVLTTNQTDVIRQIRFLKSSYLVFGEDGSFDVLQASSLQNVSIVEEIQEAFQDYDFKIKGIKKYQK